VNGRRVRRRVWNLMQRLGYSDLFVLDNLEMCKIYVVLKLTDIL